MNDCTFGRKWLSSQRPKWEEEEPGWERGQRFDDGKHHENSGTNVSRVTCRTAAVKVVVQYILLNLSVRFCLLYGGMSCAGAISNSVPNKDLLAGTRPR